MREILFRGKRIDNGEWLYGIPIETHIGTFIVCEENPHYCSQYGYMEICELANVIPETVGQYTGLTANGKKIFEGDIVQIRFEEDVEPPSTPTVWYETGKVVWCEQRHGWYVVFDNPDGIAIQEYEDGSDVFITGTIHDNPELLEVTHEQ